MSASERSKYSLRQGGPYPRGGDRLGGHAKTVLIAMAPCQNFPGDPFASDFPIKQRFTARKISMSSNSIGDDFEKEVHSILMKIQERHPNRVTLLRHEKLYLGNRLTVPDFELRFDLFFEEGRYIIECQNREKGDHSLGDKIHRTKNVTTKNRFIFVHGRPLLLVSTQN
ncbi:hypothetical protein ACC715_03555 [Rhizobium ruizarguesonis]